MANSRAPWFFRPRRALVVASCALVPIGLGCSSEDAVPLDQYNEPTESTGSTLGGVHVFEPTQQMIDLASQQCIDDPTLDEGVVEAVDPASGNVLGESRVDCATVRG